MNFKGKSNQNEIEDLKGYLLENDPCAGSAQFFR